MKKVKRVATIILFFFFLLFQENLSIAGDNNVTDIKKARIICFTIAKKLETSELPILIRGQQGWGLKEISGKALTFVSNESGLTFLPRRIAECELARRKNSDFLAPVLIRPRYSPHNWFTKRASNRRHARYIKIAATKENRLLWERYAFACIYGDIATNLEFSIKALEKIKSNESLPVFIFLYRKWKKQDARKWIVKALGNYQNNEALKALSKCYDLSDTDEEREACSKAIADLQKTKKDKELAHDITTIKQDDEDAASIKDQPSENKEGSNEFFLVLLVIVCLAAALFVIFKVKWKKK